MKSVKSKVLGLLSLIVISILIVTWFYPLSPLSVHKSYGFTADSDSVRIHNNELNNLQELYDESSPDDVTTSVLKHISPIYEGKWLVNNESISLNEDELAKMLFNVKNARKVLLTLTIQEEYTMEQRRYLLTSIEDLLSMEEMIEGIMNDNWDNRTVLKSQFKNLHGAFTSSLMIFTTFYDVTQD